MKVIKIFAASAMLISAAATPVTPAVAAGQGQGLGQFAAEAQAICEEVVIEDENATFGECMSFLLSAEQGFLGAHLCDALLEAGDLEILGITFSQCVRSFRQK